MDLKSELAAGLPGSRREHVLPLMLSFAAGYVEVISFMGLFHTFTTFITGTLMILVMELVAGHSGYLIKFVVFVSFFAFVVLWVYLIKVWPWRVELRKAAFLLLEAILIVVFAALGTILEPLASAGSIDTLVVSVAGVLAMSLHSTVFFVLLSQFAPSHFMTGNLTNFAVGLVDFLRGEKVAGEEDVTHARFRVWHYPLVIALFAAGVGLGTAVYLSVGFIALLLPALVLAGAGILAYRFEAAAAR
jgi:uncharacterized membrane protein YoaK (UPF0700 family)